MVLGAHGHPIPLAWPSGHVVLHCPPPPHVFTLWPLLHPHVGAVPMSAHHPGPSAQRRRTSRQAAWVLPDGESSSPGTRGGHRRLRRPEAGLGSFLGHSLEGALGLPAPSANPVAGALALPPVPHVTSGQGRRAGPGGSCPGPTSSVRCRLPGSSVPLGTMCLGLSLAC